MANEEALVLDSLALNDGVTFGMGSFDAPVPRQRQDWIGAADSEAQLLVRNPLHDNRKITVKLTVIPQASMNVAHDKLLLVLDKLQKASRYTDGIAMTWTPATGTRTATFDVLSAEIVDMPIDWENGWLAFSPTFTVEMTAKPYWRGTETLTSTASSSTPFVTLEVAGVTGDVPALGRLIITDTATQSRRHVEWGLEGPLTYNSGTSLIVDSDNMTVSGFAGALATTTGAYDPNAAGTSVVFATIYGALQVAVCGTGNLSHVGSFRVKARVQATAGTDVRLSWRAGDGPIATNAWVTVSPEARWVEVDLGAISVPAAVVGSQRWTGTIEAVNLTTNGGVHVDYLTLVPTSDGYGKARATLNYTPGVIAGYDSFIGTTAAAALNARVAPLGGTWATSGDATDLVFADNFNASAVDGIESIVRSTNVIETNGRYAILGATSYTDVQVDVRARSSAPFPTIEQTVIARWTDSSNHLRLVVPESGVGSTRVEQIVAGSITVLATSTWAREQQTSYRLRLIAFASGRVVGQVLSDAGTVLTEMDATSTALATAGTLATGKPGVRDRSTGVAGGSRYFTAFAVSTPAAEPIAIYSGRNMQVRYDDTLRQDSAGTYSGRPQSYRGSRFLVPVGTSRVLVKARRADVESTFDDNVTDATQIQVGWTPRGLAVPR